MQKPQGWRKRSESAYLEGGEALGKMMLWQPDRALKVWQLISGTRIWPKWFLEAFRYHYVKHNPKDYQRWKDARRAKRLQAKKRAAARARALAERRRVLGS